MVRDIARYQPDLLVVYLGHNETGTRSRRTSGAGSIRAGFAWRAWLVDTRLYGLLSRILPARVSRAR